jgi:uncharacterized membrane protein
MKDHSLLAKNINVEFDRQLSFGGRLCDHIADFAGSWIFIISFIGVMFLWFTVNSFLVVMGPFDPYTPITCSTLSSRQLLPSWPPLSS